MVHPPSLHQLSLSHSQSHTAFSSTLVFSQHTATTATQAHSHSRLFSLPLYHFITTTALLATANKMNYLSLLTVALAIALPAVEANRCIPTIPAGSSKTTVCSTLSRG